MSGSSFTNKSNKDYPDQLFEDISSLSYIKNSSNKVTSAAATTSSKNNSMQNQLLETRNGAKSLNIGVINCRESDCASINIVALTVKNITNLNVIDDILPATILMLILL